MGNIFNEDFQDFILALNSAEVKYVLVGGYSVIYHGFPRTTGDLDIFVDVSKENYNALRLAFSKFGLSMFDMTEANFLSNKDLDDLQFQLKFLKKSRGFHLMKFMIIPLMQLLKKFHCGLFVCKI